MRIDLEQMTPEDFQVITDQLEREPRGVLGIARRCIHAYPQVIVNRPVLTKMEAVMIFPTTMWLTCPYLKKKVSKIESDGVISLFQTRIDEDEEFAALVKRDHEAHAKYRVSLMPKDVLQSLANNYPNEHKVVVETGVGGVRSSDGVKCLHAHFADYLVLGSNVIGAEVNEMIGEKLHCDSCDCSLEK